MPQRTVLLWCCVPLLSAAGCVGGPFPQYAHWRPDLRKEWKQDEAFGPTYHQQVSDLRHLARNSARMTPAEQQRWSKHLSAMAAEEENSALQIEVIRTLASFPTAITAATLRNATTSGDAGVRMAAAAAWGRLGGPEAIEQLATLIGSDTDPDVRLAATRELGRFSDAAAIKALGIALDDDSPALQYRAMRSLRLATGRNYGNSVPAWRIFVQGGDPGPEKTPSVAERVRGLF